MSKEMTAEEKQRINDERLYAEAITILQGDFSDPRFVWAKRYLQDLNPNHPVLRELAKREEEYRKENAMKTDNVSVYVDNAKDLQEFANSYYSSSFGVKKKYMDVISERVEIYETDEKTGQKKALSTEKKDDYLSLLFQKSKLETSMALLGNEQYHKLSHEEKKKVFRSAADDRFFADIARVSTASSIREPHGKELEMGSREQFEYIKALSGKMKSALNKVIHTNDKLHINENTLLMSVMDTADKAQAYHTQLKEKAKTLDSDGHSKLNSVAVRVLTRKNKLEEHAEKTSKGKFKKFLLPFRENKWQIAVNTVATIGLTLTGYAVPALVAYGALMAVNAQVMPVLNESEKIRIRQKEQGLPPMNFFECWRRAHDAVTSDKKYQRKALITAGISAVAFTSLAVAAPALQGLEYLRQGVMLTRIGVANIAQGTELGFAHANASKHKDDENAQKELKSARKGLLIGLVGSGLALAVQNFDAIKEGIGHIVDKIMGRASEAADTLLTDNPIQSQSVDVPETTTSSTTADNMQTNAYPTYSTQIERFPEKWNDKMMIDKKYFNIWKSNLNNGKVANFDPQSLDRAYMNMDNEFVSHFVDKEKLHTMLEKGIITKQTYDSAAGMIEIDPSTSVSNFPTEWNSSMSISEQDYDTIMSNTRLRTFYDYTELMRNGRRSQTVLGNENFSFTDMFGKKQTGFYINTPTGKFHIEDEGIITQAKEALASGKRLLVNRLHGREFLQQQFEHLNIADMTGEKMNKAIAIAMNTFDGDKVNGAAREIGSLFDNLSEEQAQKISEIVNYNREYNEFGETLSKITRALECDDKTNFDYRSSDKLLDNAMNVLRKSNGNAVATSVNPDCPSPMVTHMVGVKTQTPPPTLPELAFEEDNTGVDINVPEYENYDTTFKVSKYEVTYAEAPKPQYRYGGILNKSDVTNNLQIGRSMTSKEFAKAMKIQQALAGKDNNIVP